MRENSPAWQRVCQPGGLILCRWLPAESEDTAECGILLERIEDDT